LIESKGELVMTHRIRAIAAATGLMAMATGVTPPHVSAQAYPPPGYFRLPATIAGVPAYQGGEGEPCGPENGNCTATERIIPNGLCGDGSTCRVDMYGVALNGPVQKGVTSYSIYQVEVYVSAARAARANAQERGADRDDANRIVPLLPIVRPADADEWIRGHGDEGVCNLYGGLHYGNMVLYAQALVPSSLRDDQCAATKAWALRVLAALHARSVAWAAK